MEKCKFCNGLGEVEELEGEGPHGPFTKDGPFECPVCFGRGEVRPKLSRETWLRVLSAHIVEATPRK
jgi:hypothetical protein